MTKIVECPVKGYEVLIPDDRMCCTKHWYEASNEERFAWMRRGNKDEE